jgi:hypothetical protein
MVDTVNLFLSGFVAFPEGRQPMNSVITKRNVQITDTRALVRKTCFDGDCKITSGYVDLYRTNKHRL